MYGLKEKMIAKAYIKLIPLGAKDPDAVRLLNWKRPTEKDVSCIKPRIVVRVVEFRDDREHLETFRQFCMKSLQSGHLLWRAHCRFSS